jgi:hypothetical protein
MLLYCMYIACGESCSRGTQKTQDVVIDCFWHESDSNLDPIDALQQGGAELRG